MMSYYSGVLIRWAEVMWAVNFTLIQSVLIDTHAS